MANVYTTKFFEIPSGSSSSYNYTVPAGYVAVVRDINAICYRNGFEYALSGFVVQTSTGSYIFGAFPEFAWVNHNYQWEGRVVLAAGEVLEVTTFDAFWSVQVAGLLLTLP